MYVNINACVCVCYTPAHLCSYTLTMLITKQALEMKAVSPKAHHQGDYTQNRPGLYSKTTAHCLPRLSRDRPRAISACKHAEEARAAGEVSLLMVEMSSRALCYRSESIVCNLPAA